MKMMRFFLITAYLVSAYSGLAAQSTNWFSLAIATIAVPTGAHADATLLIKHAAEAKRTLEAALQKVHSSNTSTLVKHARAVLASIEMHDVRMCRHHIRDAQRVAQAFMQWKRKMMLQKIKEQFTPDEAIILESASELSRLICYPLIKPQYLWYRSDFEMLEDVLVHIPKDFVARHPHATAAVLPLFLLGGWEVMGRLLSNNQCWSHRPITAALQGLGMLSDEGPIIRQPDANKAHVIVCKGGNDEFKKREGEYDAGSYKWPVYRAKQVKCVQQRGADCGYHAIFNAVAMANADHGKTDEITSQKAYDAFYAEYYNLFEAPARTAYQEAVKRNQFAVSFAGALHKYWQRLDCEKIYLKMYDENVIIAAFDTQKIDAEVKDALFKTVLQRKKTELMQAGMAEAAAETEARAFVENKISSADIFEFINNKKDTELFGVPLKTACEGVDLTNAQKRDQAIQQWIEDNLVDKARATPLCNFEDDKKAFAKAASEASFARALYNYWPRLDREKIYLKMCAENTPVAAFAQPNGFHDVFTRTESELVTNGLDAKEANLKAWDMVKQKVTDADILTFIWDKRGTAVFGSAYTSQKADHWIEENLVNKKSTAKLRSFSDDVNSYADLNEADQIAFKKAHVAYEKVIQCQKASPIETNGAYAKIVELERRHIDNGMTFISGGKVLQIIEHLKMKNGLPADANIVQIDNPFAIISAPAVSLEGSVSNAIKKFQADRSKPIYCSVSSGYHWIVVKVTGGGDKPYEVTVANSINSDVRESTQVRMLLAILDRPIA